MTAIQGELFLALQFLILLTVQGIQTLPPPLEVYKLLLDSWGIIRKFLYQIIFDFGMFAIVLPLDQPPITKIHYFISSKLPFELMR